MKPINSQQDANVEKQVGNLPNLRKRELAARWREVFKNEPPSSFGPELMRLAIAYRIQEKAYGGLRFVGAIVRFNFLAPNITSAIMDGSQPFSLNVATLGKLLVLSWVEQTKKCGFR